MSFDFAISELTTDISITKGYTVINRDNSEVLQRIKTNLQWLLGEWFLDTTKGLPLFQQIEGTKNTPSAVMLIRDQISSTSGVDSVGNINVVFNPQTRALSVYAVAVINGQNVIVDQGV